MGKIKRKKANPLLSDSPDISEPLIDRVKPYFEVLSILATIVTLWYTSVSTDVALNAYKTSVKDGKENDRRYEDNRKRQEKELSRVIKKDDIQIATLLKAYKLQTEEFKENRKANAVQFAYFQKQTTILNRTLKNQQITSRSQIECVVSADSAFGYYQNAQIYPKFKLMNIGNYAARYVQLSFILLTYDQYRNRVVRCMNPIVTNGIMLLDKKETFVIKSRMNSATLLGNDYEYTTFRLRGLDSLDKILEKEIKLLDSAGLTPQQKQEATIRGVENKAQKVRQFNEKYPEKQYVSILVTKCRYNDPYVEGKDYAVYFADEILHSFKPRFVARNEQVFHGSYTTVHNFEFKPCSVYNLTRIEQCIRSVKFDFDEIKQAAMTRQFGDADLNK